ncbi:hypothetical protein KP010_15685 [Methylosinus sp. KRF6]|nr:hypothetical protein [Methylosinus sp. KRF6]
MGSDVPNGIFDLILCRNLVFTYFELERQRDTLARIGAALRSTGYLVIGAHEELPAQTDRFAAAHGCNGILRKIGM